MFTTTQTDVATDHRVLHIRAGPTAPMLEGRSCVEYSHGAASIADAGHHP